eukprot:jgi/Botrbrau1/13395/Bobra.0082s0002.1
MGHMFILNFGSWRFGTFSGSNPSGSSYTGKIENKHVAYQFQIRLSPATHVQTYLWLVCAFNFLATNPIYFMTLYHKYDKCADPGIFAEGGKGEGGRMDHHDLSVAHCWCILRHVKHTRQLLIVAIFQMKMLSNEW